MALDRWQRTLLLSHAGRYLDKNYRVGLCNGKTLIREYEGDSSEDQDQEMDGISILPDQIACVDFDCDFKDLGWSRDLPVTWKEKTPRGWHLFYKLPLGRANGGDWVPRIHFKPDVDLLTKPKTNKWKATGIPYGGRSAKKKTTAGPDHWGEHVICSPTTGYQRIWPNEIPDFNTQLTSAPMWLIDELRPP